MARIMTSRCRNADASTVLGDFNDAVFTKDDIRTRFFKRDSRFWINTDGPDGKPADYEVKYTFGVEPLQQYLLELDRGRLQAFTVAWDTQRKRWFHLYPQERIDYKDELHWTKPSQNWNYMCAECHSTDLKKNYDEPTQTYRRRGSRSMWDARHVMGRRRCHLARVRDAGTGLWYWLGRTGRHGERPASCAQASGQRPEPSSPSPFPISISTFPVATRLRRSKCAPAATHAAP